MGAEEGQERAGQGGGSEAVWGGAAPLTADVELLPGAVVQALA